MTTLGKARRFGALEWGLILLCFAVCLAGALVLPVDQCPDEAGRMRVSDWIYETGRLPTGDEKGTIQIYWASMDSPDETVDPDAEIAGWGFSYALQPYLSAIFGALFKRAAALFTDSPRALLAASRMCSVLSVTMCCFYCLRLGRRVFERRSSALFFAAFVCFLPQVMFLGMYQNNDALSLFAVCMTLYYLAEGCDLKWPVRSCVGLAVALSVGLLSYYSVYGWILMAAVFCVAAVCMDPSIPDKGRLIGRRAALVAGICLLLAGWFFIRNALLHDGDFFGLASELKSRERFKAQGYVLYDYVCYRDKGMSIARFLRFKHFEWIRMTAKSFVGTFGHMIFYLPTMHYVVYFTLICLGVLLFLAVSLRRRPNRRDRLLLLMMLASTGIAFLLHLWQSYARDYQPQGRYVITATLPLGFMIAYGLEHSTGFPSGSQERNAPALRPAAAFTVLWLLLFAWACLGTMTKMLA